MEGTMDDIISQLCVSLCCLVLIFVWECLIVFV